MRRVLLLAAALAASLVSAAFADAPPVTPEPPAAPAARIDESKAGSLYILDGRASTGTGHVWRIVPPTDSHVVVDGGTKLVFAPPAAGEWTFILAVGVGGSTDVATWKITHGPPGPGPAPVDPFVQSLQAAYQTTGPSSARLLQVKSLARIWREAAETTVADPKLTTAADLLAAVSTVVRGTLADDLVPVREAIAKELDGKLAVAPRAPLDAALRAKCKTEFARVATSLEALR